MKTKQNIIEEMAREVVISKNDAEKCLNFLTSYILKNVKNDIPVNITGFGKFEKFVRHARNGVNPQCPDQSIVIPEVETLKFRTGKVTQDYISGKRKTL